MASKIDLTISIVSYNTKDLLRRCLESIFKRTKGLKFEIIVVDNASTDGSSTMVRHQFPQVKIIANKKNRFYTAANNQALKLARGKYFLILNSDIFLTTNAFQKTVNYLDHHPRVGAIEPLQIYETGAVAPTGSRHNQALLDFFELTWLGRKIANRKLLRRLPLTRRTRRATWPVEVICDAALMVRTKVIRQIGGYDERLKLYYTENDLCRRIQGLGFTTVHYGQAQVKHRVSASTNQESWQKISHLYAQDALHYYRNWQGLLLYLSLIINNSAIDLIKNKWPFVFIFILAAILRVWHLAEFMPFIGDFGHDYLKARDLLIAGKIPLVGIASSVPWLYQGSLWIYLVALSFLVANFHPVAPAVLTAILSLVTLWAIIAIAWAQWGKLAAIASGLIYAASPLSVAHARTPWHTSPIPLVAIGYFYALLRRSSFWSAFFFSLLFQFELSNAPLILLLLFTRINKRSLLGLLIPLIPKIIYDLTHNFSQTGGFILWLGYRIAAFFGYRGGHTVSISRLLNTSQIIFDYLQKFLSPGLWLPTSLILLFIFITLIQAKKFSEYLIGLWILIIGISYYVHGTPSEAYFPVLFPILALTLGWGISRSKFLLLPVIALSVLNSWWLVTHRFGLSGPSFSERIAATDQIIRLSPPGQPIKLIARGEGSQHASFLDNYYYLLWWRQR